MSVRLTRERSRVRAPSVPVKKRRFFKTAVSSDTSGSSHLSAPVSKRVGQKGQGYMYFSRKTHFLSLAIMLAALIRLSGSMIEGFIRMVVNRNVTLTPDMMDSILWNVQAGCSLAEISLIALVFYLSLKKLRRYKGLVDEDDYAQMGRLQEEVFGKNISSLSADSIEQLLQMWAVILIGAECVYFCSSIVYKRFTTELMLLLFGGRQYTSFVSIYNLTHGFKYLEMLTAIVLGVVMTAIVLHDRYLKIAAAVITVVFLLAFGIFQMQTIQVSGRQIGIVWTSVIFHLTETIGLFILSVYLSKHYRGL